MEIRPFHGWHYRGPDISSQIAPPYDVLTGDDKARLLEGDPQNIVAVDLPHVPPKELGPDAAYDASADLLSAWCKSGILVQDKKPALYAYAQTYTWAGKTFTRRAMLAGVRATPLGQDVIPHEHTFAGPKADRLKLTTVTQMQLSPIFGFYEDPIGVNDVLWGAVADEPTLSGELNGVREELWVVTDPDALEKVQSALAPVPVYIADGHHRYTTALNYRNALEDAGLIDDDHAANFVMFALVPRDDAGLLVLPTHRVVSDLADHFKLDDLLASLGEDFVVEPIEDIGQMDLADTYPYLAGRPQGTKIIVAEGRGFAVRLAKAERMVDVAADHCPAWHELDVAILHELVLDRALAPWKTDATSVDYTPDGNQARSAVFEGGAQVAFLLKGTPLQSVEAVADAGDSMPHKSTYFYPKLATGMVLKPLD